MKERTTVEEGEKGGKLSEKEREREGREAERMKTNSKHFDKKEDSQVIVLRCVQFCKLLYHAET